MHLSKVLKQLIPITQFNKGKASQLVSRVKDGETLVVMKNNVAVAVVISPEEYSIIERYKLDGDNEGNKYDWYYWF